MMIGPRRSRWIAATLFVAALGGSAPIVRWCPRGWACVPLEALVRCALASEQAGADCVATERGDAPARCGADARETATPCSAMSTCPMREAARTAESCETARTATPCEATGDPPPCAAAPTRTAPAHRRAFCLDAPALAAGANAQPPTLDPPHASAVLAILALAIVPPEQPAIRARPEVEPRPPTRVADARPPVRGPPLLG